MEGDGEFGEGKRQFMEACWSRRQRGELRRGPEEMVAGCGCFLRLSDRSLASAVQVLLLVVRRRWRKSGLGSFLQQVCVSLCVRSISRKSHSILYRNEKGCFVNLCGL